MSAQLFNINFSSTMNKIQNQKHFVKDLYKIPEWGQTT